MKGSPLQETTSAVNVALSGGAVALCRDSDDDDDDDDDDVRPPNILDGDFSEGIGTI